MSKLFPNATIRTSAPYRFDIVGSFLRPEALKQARYQCSCGDISCADLTQVEDAEIAKLVEHQKNVGLHAVTDGEFVVLLAFRFLSCIRWRERSGCGEILSAI